MRGLRRRLRLNRYKRLEYLEFIDFYSKTVRLGINTSPNMKLRIRLSVPSNNNYAFITGTYSDSYSNVFAIGKKPSGEISYNNKSNIANIIVKSGGVAWDIYIKSLSQKIPTTYNGTFAQLGIDYGLEKELVFGVTPINFRITNKDCKLYYLIIDDGNGRKMDLQPVKRLKDGKNGLLDTVSGKFFDFTGMVKEQ